MTNVYSVQKFTKQCSVMYNQYACYSTRCPICVTMNLLIHAISRVVPVVENKIIITMNL